MVKVAPLPCSTETKKMESQPSKDATAPKDGALDNPSLPPPTSDDPIAGAHRKILQIRRDGAAAGYKNKRNLNYSNPKQYLKNYCQSMCTSYDLPTRAYIDVKGNENMIVCLGNHISFCQSLGNRGTKEQMECYLKAYATYFKKTGIELKSVPIEMWLSTLEYLSLNDLKNFRLVSTMANYLVENTWKWANKVCFVYDERMKYYRECPYEQICEDKTVGWPALRLKNCTPRFTPAFWKDIQVVKSITMLHLHDCNLNGANLLNLLANMYRLQEFNYTLCPNRIDHLKIQKRLEEFYDCRRNQKKLSMRDERSEFARNIKKRHLRYDKSKGAETLKFSEILPRIKRIYLNTASLGITNVLLDILEELVCNSLEELKIHCRMEMSFIPYATEVMMEKKNSNKSKRGSKVKKKIIKAVEKKAQIRAKKLIENNQSTLVCLELALNSGDTNEEFEEFAELQGRPTLVMISHLFDESNFPMLALEELIIDFPNLLPAINHHNSENVNDGCAYCAFRQLIEFCEGQTELEKLVLRRIHSSTSTRPLLKYLKKVTKHAKVDIWGTIYPGHLGVDREDIGPMLEVVDLQLGGNDCMKSYTDFYKKDKKSMENVKRLEIRSESKWLTEYKVSMMVQKFPNLTRLVLADVRMRSDGLLSAPKFDDTDFQDLIKSLPTLKELVIRANMGDVTDFGFTGFTNNSQTEEIESKVSIQRRISQLKKFYSKDDKEEEMTELSQVGVSINQLKKLELLELHGLGPRVTEFTANFIALDPHPNLRELYLFKPDFGKEAVKLIKTAFAYRNGFAILVAKP